MKKREKKRETPEEARARLASPERCAEVEALTVKFYAWLKATHFAVKPDLQLPGLLIWGKRTWELGRFRDGGRCYHLVVTRNGESGVYSQSPLNSFLGEPYWREYAFKPYYGVFLDDMRERIAQFTAQCPTVPWQG